VKWADFYSSRKVSGAVSCPPFVEDPPCYGPSRRLNNKHPDDSPEYEAECEALSKKVDNAEARKRPDWNLRRIPGLKETCEGWRRAAGLKANALRWEDVARAVCAGVGMLARDEEGNQGTFVLRRVMLRLEREMRALKNPAFDKTALSAVDAVRKNGGLLTCPAVMECLKREKRWDNQRKTQSASVSYSMMGKVLVHDLIKEMYLKGQRQPDAGVSDATTAPRLG